MARWLAVVAALITLFVFLTGIPNLRHLFDAEDNPVGTMSNTVNPADFGRSDVQVGDVALGEGDGFSFALGQKTYKTAGDVWLEWDYWGPELRLHGVTLGGTLGAVSFDEIREVPKVNWLTSNDTGLDLQTGHLYYLRVGGTTYVKFTVLSATKAGTRGTGVVSIKYALQRNGSRVFD